MNAAERAPTSRAGTRYPAARRHRHHQLDKGHSERPSWSSPRRRRRRPTSCASSRPVSRAKICLAVVHTQGRAQHDRRRPSAWHPAARTSMAVVERGKPAHAGDRRAAAQARPVVRRSSVSTTRSASTSPPRTSAGGRSTYRGRGSRAYRRLATAPSPSGATRGARARAPSTGRRCNGVALARRLPGSSHRSVRMTSDAFIVPRWRGRVAFATLFTTRASTCPPASACVAPFRRSRLCGRCRRDVPSRSIACTTDPPAADAAVTTPDCRSRCAPADAARSPGSRGHRRQRPRTRVARPRRGRCSNRRSPR